jgi:hypothetical protein
LLFRGDGGLYQIDPSTPGIPPRLWFPMVGGSVGAQWSPDGTWIALALNRGISPVKTETVVALPAVGERPPDTLYVGRPLMRWLWSDEGTLFGWERRGRKAGPQFAIAAPPYWQARYRGPAHARSTLMSWPDGSVRRFVTVPAPGLVKLPGLDTLRTWPEIELVDAFPGRDRFLVRRGEQSFSRGGTFVMDADGNMERAVGRASWNSVSADGRYLAGGGTISSGDCVFGSDVIVGDAAGTWSIRLPELSWDRGASYGGGGNPLFSREGMFLATFIADSVEVGRLTIEPR